MSYARAVRRHAVTAAETSKRQVGFGEPAGRWVVVATVLGSSLAVLDATVVNVALERIGEGLRADLADLQWTLGGYALTLASLILLGGALGDCFGRRRVFVLGAGWVAAASAFCGLAPNVETLIAARALQGVVSCPRAGCAGDPHVRFEERGRETEPGSEVRHRHQPKGAGKSDARLLIRQWKSSSSSGTAISARGWRPLDQESLLL